MTAQQVYADNGRHRCQGKDIQDAPRHKTVILLHQICHIIAQPEPAFHTVQIEDLTAQEQLVRGDRHHTGIQVFCRRQAIKAYFAAEVLKPVAAVAAFSVVGYPVYCSVLQHFGTEKVQVDGFHRIPDGHVIGDHVEKEALSAIHGIIARERGRLIHPVQETLLFRIESGSCLPQFFGAEKLCEVGQIRREVFCIHFKIRQSSGKRVQDGPAIIGSADRDQHQGYAEGDHNDQKVDLGSQGQAAVLMR